MKRNITLKLQDMGNVFLAAIEDIHFFKDEWAADMDKEPVWQYAFLNGPGRSQALSAAYYRL